MSLLALPSRNETCSVLYRIAQVAGWFVSARLILLYAGREEYGFVAVILSLAAWLQMFDFGITSYLRSELPKARSRGGEGLVASYYKSGVVATLAIAAPVLIALNVALFTVPALPEAVRSLLAADQVIDLWQLRFILLGLSAYAAMLIAINIMQAYLAAFERQYVLFLLGIAGCALQPIAVGWAASSGESVATIFLLSCLMPVVPAFAYVLVKTFLILKGTRRTGEFHPINRTSLSFLVIQFGGALFSNFDLLVVTHLFGLGQAAVYSLFKMIVQFPISVHAQFNLQSWPLYAMHSTSAEGYPRIRALMMRNVRITALASVLLIVTLTPAGPWFVQMWSDGALSANYTMAFLFAVYGAVFMTSNTFSVLMFAFNYTRGIVPLVLLVPPCFVTLVWLTQSFGLEGVLVSNILVYALGLGVGVWYYTAKVSRRAPVTEVSRV